MMQAVFRRVSPLGVSRGGRRPLGSMTTHERRGDDAGFTLVELLIVTTILPLIIGALSLGLISVFSLNSSVSNRIGDTADAQVVSANYASDVESAAAITTSASVSPECTTTALTSAGATQVLGLQADPNSGGVGGYQTVISYLSVPVVNGSTTTYSLVRLLCENDSLTPTTTTYIATDLPSLASLQLPQITCVASAKSSLCSSAGQQWTTGYISTQNVKLVTFTVTEPNSGYLFNLVASPVQSTSNSTGGQPITNPTGTTCGYADASSGGWANNLCFIDFSSLLNQNSMNAANANLNNGGCLQMSVSVLNTDGSPTGDTLYFCMSLVGPDSGSENSPFIPHIIPTYPNAWMGANGGYTGIPGDPALYFSQETETASIQLTNIFMANSQGSIVSGWQMFAADAETTDNVEYMQWTSDKDIFALPNNTQGQAEPFGNACMGDGKYASGTLPTNLNPLYPAVWTGTTASASNPTNYYGITGNGTTTFTCWGTLYATNTSPFFAQTTSNFVNGGMQNQPPGSTQYSVTTAAKTGTAMVVMSAPSTLTVKATHYEAMSFGVFLP